MLNEVFTADIEVRLRSSEASYLLRLYRKERAAGEQATIAMLTSEVMKAYGSHLVVLEQNGEGDYAFLYAGARVPDHDGQAITGKLTSAIAPETAELYRIGCQEAHELNDAVCINHITKPNCLVHHWECLFLPMEDSTHRRMFVTLCMPREHKDDFLRNLLDNTPEAMVAATPLRDSHGEVVDAVLLYANKSAADLSGHEDINQMVGTSMMRLFGDVATAGAWARNLTVLRSGKALQFEFHHRTQTDSRWLRVSSMPTKDGLLASFHDITNQKRAQLELEHQKKMLMDEMEQRRGLEQELWALAHLDPLTSLPNRRAFRESALVKLAESQTAHRPLALISLDIDHFKHINDAYGHGAGDTVLRRVADVLKAPLRPNTDMAARVGGEEFAVILPDTDIDSATAFAEKLRRRIEQTVVVVGEHEIRPTISLGVAMNRRSTNLDELMDRSDRALYTAKRTGRNKVCTEVDVQEKPGLGSTAAA
ncbi:MAG: diguanylate cyclase [Methylobacterium sp.]|nr:diguanylate cyclase [Methylobacterium sp.]MCA3612734.1 diguanylate cyclase [Methylobacterium sp.]MCA3623490.1 diguanylate cyclase [Methylobacterium sp.]